MSQIFEFIKIELFYLLRDVIVNFQVSEMNKIVEAVCTFILEFKARII